MHTKGRLSLFVVATWLITSVLAAPLDSGQGQTETFTRPAVSETASPLESIAPVAQDGYRGHAILRKPPGNGPFPAVVLIHGGLTTVTAERLRSYVLEFALPSRFLAAGYVVASITYRSRDVDPQSRVSADDSLAAVEHVRRLPYVNRDSVGVVGCSGGGDLALAVAVESRVAAIVAEEPASMLFTGVFNSKSPKAGERYTPRDTLPIYSNPRAYYTAEHQRLTRAKIAKIQSPILILQGDVKVPIAVNEYNAAVLIPELRSARKSFEVMTYPGEPHCFAFGAQPTSVASTIKAFADMDAFVRRHVTTQPKPLDAALLTQVALALP